jgi:hypothetical protein
MFDMLVIVVGAEPIIKTKLELYRWAYQQGTNDTCEFLEKCTNNQQIQDNLSEYIKQREIELNNLTGRMTCTEQVRLLTRQYSSYSISSMSDNIENCSGSTL